MVGLSDKPHRDSHRVARYKHQQGTQLSPAHLCDGPRNIPDLEKIERQIDIIDIFRRAEHVPSIVDSAIRIKARKCGCSLVRYMRPLPKKRRLQGSRTSWTAAFSLSTGGMHARNPFRPKRTCLRTIIHAAAVATRIPSATLFFGLLCIPLSSLAQQQDSLRLPDRPLGIIDTIIVSGNEKTKAYVILDEMTLKPGLQATSEAIEFDRSRVYSLGLFTRVDMYFDSLGGQRFLYVDVSERWYLIPLPLFGFRDGDPKRAYYGAGLLHNNFRGRNQKLFGSIVFGYNPAIGFSFFDPLFDREENVYFSAGLSSSLVRNKSQIESAITGDFDERHYDINITFGKRFNLYESSGINLGYQIVEISEYRLGRTASTSGRDDFIYCSVNYAFDSRDLREYAMKGRYYSLYATKNGFGESDVNFTRFGVDLRHYIPLAFDVSLAARVHATIVSGSFIPTYTRAYIGYGEKIRGYFRTVFEGENLAGTTLELRYPLLSARTITFTAVPLPPEFAIWRFGISLALFADAGATWFRQDKLQLASFASGYGGGVHLLLPYGYVARFEYAYNEYFKGQFIVDLRASI